VALGNRPSKSWHVCFSLFLLGILIFLALWPYPSLGAPPQNSAEDPGGIVMEFPGREELIPLSTILGVEAAEVRTLLDKTGNQKEVLAQINESQEALLSLDQRLAGWGPVNQWSEGRLLGARSRLQRLNDQQNENLDKLTAPLRALHEIQQNWQKKQAFWKSWASRPGWGAADAEQLRKSQKLVSEILTLSMLSDTSVVELQQRLSAQKEIIVAWIVQVDAALSGLRGPLLSRNAPPLLSEDFFRQINRSLWAGLGEDIDTALQVPADFAPRQGWVAIVQLVLTLFLSWQFYRRALQPEPVAEHWHFLFRHPVAGAVFIVLIGSSFLYVSPPMLWRWVQMILGTVAATVLICAMLERPRLRRVIITLAALFICSTTIRLIGLVQPLHRLFLVAVCVIATPLCLAAARRQRQRRGGRLDLLAVAFYLGTLAGLIGLLAQVTGYYSLSAYLVNAFLGTTFVYLFARMGAYMGDGAIDALFATQGLQDRRFLRFLGPRIVPRLKILWHVIVVANAFLYLMAQWNIYPTAGDAWTGLRALSFSVGELQVSLEVVLMAIVVIYLTFIISWLLQALLDAEVMTPRGVEHGVKFAIKTLVHYSLILVGFMVAISVAGVDMSKFAILAGALGVGIGFGLQNIVNNFLSGLILLFERPIKIGDTISLDDQWGTVTRIGLRSTVVETLDRAELIVPNSELIAQKVTNWTFTTNVSRVVIPVGVAYGSSLEKVVKILLEVAQEQGQVLVEPSPSAIFTGFGDSSIDFELRVWINDVSHRLRIRSELGIAIDKRFREAGIVIPFPQRDLHLQSVAPTLQAMVRPPAKGKPTSAKDVVE